MLWVPPKHFQNVVFHNSENSTFLRDTKGYHCVYIILPQRLESLLRRATKLVGSDEMISVPTLAQNLFPCHRFEARESLSHLQHFCGAGGMPTKGCNGFEQRDTPRRSHLLPVFVE